MGGRRTSQGETDSLDFADMWIKNGKLAVGNRIESEWVQTDGHIEIGVIDSKFYYGGVEGGGSTDTGVLMEAGKEYILLASMDFVEDKFALTIKDADNNILFAGEKVGLGWGYGTEEINYINLPSLSDGNTVTMDYVRLYDGDYIDVSEFSAEKPVFDKDKLTVGESVNIIVYKRPGDVALTF